MSSDNVEDILNDSLSFFGGRPVIERDIITYGPLQLTVAPKEGKANTLLADHLFSPSLFLAERIERALIPIHGRTVVELGSGCGLPSLLMATMPEPPKIAVLTDYPDEGIMGNLNENVARNASLFSSACTVYCLGYDWGTDVSHLLSLINEQDQRHQRPGFDIVILSDLLHFHSSHDALIDSLARLLSKSSASRTYASAGKYTHAHVCDNFISRAREQGFSFEEILSPEGEAEWMGRLDVSDLDKDALTARKSACRFWVGRWA
ncbi:nicotinamide n-methyltransferase nnt1 [Moniliophthora roreri MCA 2997]|uniref:Nicotinamide n-methyltransferase nnt1 n=1 Tax=Moniliophthora roreri (strain MCA 2997) TaxID=1381753 RepID=V2XCQ9_MONRO|nr:nicotinamide n-methyltransferase nnt1 [Moniliophthora roreri MCA 2997]